MYTKLFHRLSYLLLLFQIPCFAALQTVSLDSTNVDNVSNKNDVICTIHSEESEIEPKNFGNKLLVYGFIREFEPKVASKTIPDCIMSLCVGFSRRMLPCNCIKEKYRKLDIDKNRKRAIMFFLMYKIEDVQEKKYTSKKTFFHCACKDGHLGLAKRLEEQGANVNAKDKEGNNALHYACLFSGSVEMVTWLLDVCKLGLEAKGQNQKTPFLCAAKKGQLAIAKLLKEEGANTKAKDWNGNNALHLACFDSGSVDMVKWLVDECKIGLETKGQYEKTPFLCAAKGGQLKIAKLLRKLDAMVDAKDKYGDNALHLACYKDSVEMVTWLLDTRKIDIESKGEYQKTPFICAAEGGKLGIAKLLKERGANIHARDKDGNNALHAACLFSGSVDMIKWLLDECKILIETKGYVQETPFLCAAQKGQLAIAKQLKDRGANIHAKNIIENNALHMACLYSGSVQMTTWLLDECKIGLETKGYRQQTPFLCAAKKGQLAIAKLLNQRGANIHAKDKDGHNALYFAKKYSTSEEMVNYLTKLGLS